jgi:hypothetical protein
MALSKISLKSLNTSKCIFCSSAPLAACMYVYIETEFLSKTIVIYLRCYSNCKRNHIHAKHHTQYQYLKITFILQL